MKILLAKRRALGDTVLLSATVALLKKQMPEAEIHVLVPTAFAPLLLENPYIEKIISFEGQSFVALVQRLRREKFDFFFQLHSSPSAFWLTKLSGAKVALEHMQNKKTEEAYGKHPNALEWDRFFLKNVFQNDQFLTETLPQIYLNEDELEIGKNYWRHRNADPKKVVFLGLGASRATKRWPAAHFARFAELLRDRLDFIPAIVHGSGEAEEKFAGEVLGLMRVKGFRPQNAVGERGGMIFAAGLSVRALAGAIAATRAYVGNDSGPKHMAVALGVPSFTFFGPEDPVEWHPYSRETHPIFFLPGLKCRTEDNGRWCGIPICIQERHRCMQDLDPLEAFLQFQKFLGV